MRGCSGAVPTGAGGARAAAGRRACRTAGGCAAVGLRAAVLSGGYWEGRSPPLEAVWEAERRCDLGCQLGFQGGGQLGAHAGMASALLCSWVLLKSAFVPMVRSRDLATQAALTNALQSITTSTPCVAVQRSSLHLVSSHTSETRVMEPGDKLGQSRLPVRRPGLSPPLRSARPGTRRAAERAYPCWPTSPAP